MDCIKCGKSCYKGGTVIFAMERNYKLCPACLKKETKGLSIYKAPDYTERGNKRFETKQRAEFLQRQVDEKLNYYLLEGVEWKVGY